MVLAFSVRRTGATVVADGSASPSSPRSLAAAVLSGQPVLVSVVIGCVSIAEAAACPHPNNRAVLNRIWLLRRMRFTT